jgi:hypothetical protein
VCTNHSNHQLPQGARRLLQTLRLSMLLEGPCSRASGAHAHAHARAGMHVQASTCVFMCARAVLLPSRRQPPRPTVQPLALLPHLRPPSSPQREESDPRYITNATDVKLRSFTTKVRAQCGQGNVAELCRSARVKTCALGHRLMTDPHGREQRMGTAPIAIRTYVRRVTLRPPTGAQGGHGRVVPPRGCMTGSICLPSAHRFSVALTFACPISPFHSSRAVRGRLTILLL